MYTKVITTMVSAMALVPILHQKENNMKAISPIIKNQGRDIFIHLMGKFIKVFLQRIRNQEKATVYGLMLVITKGNGKIIWCMVKVNIPDQMAIHIKANLLVINLMVKENLHTPTALVMKEAGKMDSSMVKALLHLLMVSNQLVCG